MTGEFLPPQLIYQGKTSACLPRYKFPDDWHVTCTPNHWSCEDKMKEYIEHIIMPYVDCKHKALKLTPDHPLLAIFDVFKGQQTKDVLRMLEENNIHVVSIPANCTDRLQPMDVSVNKSVKEFMQTKFREWYLTQVQHQLDEGAKISPVDLKMSTMKPLGARWLVSLYDYLKENSLNWILLLNKRSSRPGIDRENKQMISCLGNMANDGLPSDHCYIERIGSVAIFTLAW